MMLFPLTSIPSFATRISEANPFARRTSRRGAGVQAEPVQDVELAFRTHRHRISTPTKRRNDRISDGETAFRKRTANRCTAAAARRSDPSVGHAPP